MCKKVLFITEGPIDELHLLMSICSDLGMVTKQTAFYSYKTDFHQFARLMLPNNSSQVDEALDVLLTLKSQEKNADNIKILSEKYTDIFIIFDLDPHAIRTEFKKIRALASFFTDSSDMGRLFINYPMMQSYRHLKHLPDIDFKERKVTISQIKNYKNLVTQEALPELIKTHHYNHIQLYEIACHHYCKREKMLGREYAITPNSKYDSTEDLKILDMQLADIEKNKQCSVLNTSVLIFLEYRPKQFFSEVIRHRDRFRI